MMSEVSHESDKHDVLEIDRFHRLLSPFHLLTCFFFTVVQMAEVMSLWLQLCGRSVRLLQPERVAACLMFLSEPSHTYISLFNLLYTSYWQIWEFS